MSQLWWESQTESETDEPALAVVKWKKLRGFYRDLEREHHCTYTTDGNMLLNGDLE